MTSIKIGMRLLQGSATVNTYNKWLAGVNYYFNANSGSSAGGAGMINGYNNTGGTFGEDMAIVIINQSILKIKEIQM